MSRAPRGLGGGDGQVVVPGGEALQRLVRVAEGGPEREALAVVPGQLGEGGQGPLGGELRWAGEMQGP